jgi:hypothetical protein
VRELEQLLQTLEARRTIKDHIDGGAGESPSPFAGFFAFPQYSTATSGHGGGGDAHSRIVVKPAETTTTAAGGGAGAAIADIEASMVEGHASVKVQARRRPRQLLKLVAGLHQLGLTTLHLNVTTVAAMAMYSFSLKVSLNHQWCSIFLFLIFYIDLFHDPTNPPTSNPRIYLVYLTNVKSNLEVANLFFFLKENVLIYILCEQNRYL